MVAFKMFKNTHELINLHISAMAYYINTLDGLCMAGVNQNGSKMGTFFEKYVPHFMLIFEKKSHPIRPVEGLKLCLDFLCNTDIT